MSQTAVRIAPDPSFDVVVVGAGFAGMYLIHRLRKQGKTVRVFEAGTDVGGTWYWNRYPGCRVDVVSMEYSYEFSAELQQEWRWSEKYATQPELLRYARHVADRFDLRRDIQFRTRVTAAEFDADSGRWHIETDQGDRVTAQYFVLATGLLSTTNLPPFPGLETFTGDKYHTGLWPHEPVDFSGKRVAVIGTGSSAVQSIPLIAAQAEHLTIFQRTANYVIPARNEPLDDEEVGRIKAEYESFRERNLAYPFAFFFESTGKSALEVSDAERERFYEEAWARGGLMFLGIFTDLLFSHEANATAQDFFRRKLASIVHNPETAERLMPHFSLGCKRLIVGTDYYETFNRDNVSLVDIKDSPIERITPRGVVVDGQEHEVDAIVFATGFDAITGSVLGVDIRGLDGRSMRDKWAEGARAYLGLMAEGFPNCFIVTGPGSPSVLSNVLKSIEQHVDFIGQTIADMEAAGAEVIEPTLEAEDAWVLEVDGIASRSVYKSCDSWYVGSNIPGKPRVFTAYIGWPQYADELKKVVAAGYDGFRLMTRNGDQVRMAD